MAVYKQLTRLDRPPNANDDLTGGYLELSQVSDTITKKIYVCRDCTQGAAKWVEIPVVVSGMGPPAPEIGELNAIYFDLSDPSNPMFYFKG